MTCSVTARPKAWCAKSRTSRSPVRRPTASLKSTWVATLAAQSSRTSVWFFGAFNPQTPHELLSDPDVLHTQLENKVTIPFYAGKITWALNNANTFTASTFGDFTKVEGFLATGALTNVNGFGNDIRAFTGRQETGGHNYAFRLNSTIRPNFIGEFSGGLHFQRANTIPTEIRPRSFVDNFAVLRNGAVLTPVSTGVTCPALGLHLEPVSSISSMAAVVHYSAITRAVPDSVSFSTQDRDRYEINAHMQNIAGKHTVKWGFEWFRNMYDIATLSSGPAVTYAFTPGLGLTPTNGAIRTSTNGSRITNNWLVCTTRANAITCPTAASVSSCASHSGGHAGRRWV